MEQLPPPSKKKVVTFVEYFYEQGFQIGFEIGFEKGFESEIGKQKAREEFAEQNRAATASMIRKGLSDADICEILKVTPKFVSLIRADVSAT